MAQKKRRPEPDPDPVELVYGAPEFGLILVERFRAVELIDAKENWRTWGAAARAIDLTWAEFVDTYPNLVDEWGDEGTLRARWALAPDALLAVFEEIIGASPASMAADLLLEQCPDSVSYPQEFVTFSSNDHNESFAELSTEESAEALQRFLDTNGLAHIRLLRDDAFIRRLWA